MYRIVFIMPDYTGHRPYFSGNKAPFVYRPSKAATYPYKIACAFRDRLNEMWGPYYAHWQLEEVK